MIGVPCTLVNGRDGRKGSERGMGTLLVQDSGKRRTTLSRDRVLRCAVRYADANGIQSLSMRSLANELDVVPMALYKHVASKEDLLDGMVEIIVGEIDRTPAIGHWKHDVRLRILAARESLLRHPWALSLIHI